MAVDDTSDVAVSSELVGSHRVAVAESCTGGLVSQALARAAGSGEWFLGGIVAYRREVKYALLDVEEGPVVNERAARQMAAGVAALLGASAAVAVTGAAGPEPQDGAEPGTVAIAVFVDGDATASTHRFAGSPPAVCEQARDTALEALATTLRTRLDAPAR